MEQLVSIAVGVRLATGALLSATSALSPFDSSSSLLVNTRLEPLLRWDSAYFLNTALTGYTHEHELAFMPALPLLANALSRVVPLESNLERVLLGGVLAAACASVAATLVLYQLSLDLSLDPTFAFLSALLFILPPSPPTLNAVPYNEPFFALTTFLGMLLFVRRRWVPAALAWAIGSVFRGQGIILGLGFFGWHFVLAAPRASNGSYSLTRLLAGIPAFVSLSALSVAPFFLFQWWAYREFCGGDALARPWCNSTLGTSYGWIQSEYWDVGPFRYWTLQQLPNFLLAAPVLLLSFAASWTYYSHNLFTVLSFTLPFLPLSPPTQPHRRADPPFLSPALTPFVHLHTALTLLLLFASHVQIILRLCSSNPVVFWYAAYLVRTDVNVKEGGERAGKGEGRTKWGRWWVGYCVVWGVVSTVLWGVFLPPA